MFTWGEAGVKCGGLCESVGGWGRWEGRTYRGKGGEG